MIRTALPATVDDVELDPVGDDGWRVRARTEDPREPEAVLGFITPVDGGFEAHRLGLPQEDVTCPSLEDALSRYVAEEPLPAWIRSARKDPRTGFLGEREVVVGTPEAEGAGLLVVHVDGELAGHVVATTPIAFVAERGDLPPLVVESMDGLLALVSGLRR
ncbi:MULTISPECIES: hypothetical protein [unclassified Rathayibacter]|uniref:hypothetical protein n=1 Tax=unclassified Rathayibacter TaxID=2609250 RepID=UPI000CE887BD|nr:MULTISPECIES: hypothetical protein [unclassified Rathayibacter]PPF29289.1 hypothetical protein C5C54_03775 [Rathayibacter sp. AY1F2]PPG33012.1 hypothetical protein C5C25_05155 [Rathayibacter sp. AY2B9]PPG54650.1 hypothetical protein C5C41_04045 [Rathayibacter sp. AY1E9]PPG59214.1 hypothetical protein C5C57_08030 [Rathayibacter sp. AY1C5]PPH22872.1 hypothetical protein C5C99_03470 [Rathayibacter sp. AY1C4]